MGLDVYLYKYPDKEHFDNEQKYSRLSDRLYNEYTKDTAFDKLPKPLQLEYEDKLKKAAEVFGLDNEGRCKGCEHIHKNSAKHPKHYFKIGYFRSSYNGGGINTILRNSIGKDLYYVFQPPTDEYYIRPQWKECLTRAKTLLKEFKKFTENYSFRVDPVFHCVGHGPANSQEATKFLIDELGKMKKDKLLFGAYSNANGHFYLKEPQKIIAIMTGTLNILNDPTPCTYVAFEEDYKWYVEAIEIVIETIEYVIKSGESDKYVLAWSG